MKSSSLLILSGLLASSCAAPIAVVPPTATQQPTTNQERPRPAWLAHVASHVSNVRACLSDHLPPAGIVYLERGLEAATGVTLIDGLGAAEHCAARDGIVIHREDAAMRASDLAGSAVFAPGTQRPSVPPLEPVEEVVDQDRTVGFVYWLPIGRSDEAVDVAVAALEATHVPVD